MRVLLVGGGGREHALAWKLARSPLLTELVAAPGNPGIAEHARCEPIGVDDLDGLVRLARAMPADLVVVGPEAPLVAGLADRLAEAGIACFGPSGAAAALEGSKGFMKDLCAAHGIPTAAYARFTEITAARAHVAAHTLPVVVKADGLAAGKGVTICHTRDEADAALRAALVDGRLGEAGASVVVEAFLKGEEVSVFALADGETVAMFGSAQDHKAVGEGDTGPMTGGMGAYAPAPVATPALLARVEAEIVRPLVAAMAARGTPFQGVVFAGIMVTADGAPQLLEINVRFGDPECEVLMTRLDGDLLPLLDAVAHGRLGAMPPPRFRDEAAIAVVMAARGYPGPVARGGAIRLGPETPHTRIFHAGTARDPQGELVAAGGRVLAVTATGPDLGTARDRAYAAIDAIDWPQGFCRRDIGWRALDQHTLGR